MKNSVLILLATLISVFSLNTSAEQSTEQLVTLNFQVKAETKNEFMDFLDMSIPNVRGFEGNTNVQLYFDATTNEMIITESWASKKAHGKYIKFISENGVMKQLLSYLEKPPTIKYYQPLDV